MTFDHQSLLQGAVVLVPKIIAAAVIMVLGFLAARAASAAIHRSLDKRITHPETTHLLSRLTRWSILILASIIALSQVNFDVTAFLTGLGVAGVTIGFALQDIAQNFIAGVILLIRRPFSIGDAVNIAGFSGSVTEVRTRDTSIRTWDGESVVLPNKQILNAPITNYSRADNRRRTVRVGLSYAQDLDQARATLLETIAAVDGVLADPAPMVHGEELGDYAITVAVRFWLNQRTSSLLDVHSDVVFAIQRAARNGLLDIPFPIQVLHLRQPESADND